MGYSNVSRPMGFTPNLPVGKTNASVQPRPIAATRTASSGGNASTDIAIGDAYSIDVNGNAYRAGPNDSVRGIVIGFRFLAISTIMNGNGPVSQDYSPAGSVSELLGIEDAQVEFFVQADTFAVTNNGGEFNLADAAPDSTLSQSRQTLNVGGGIGTQFRAQEIDQSFADNNYGANARVVVRMLQTYKN
jgi:hypothetical protein